MIEKHPKSVVVRLNNKISVECLAYGIVSINYQWEKYCSFNNSWMVPSKKGINVTSPKLMFTTITEEDEGIYRCLVFNSDCNRVSDNATITVYGKQAVLKTRNIFSVCLGPPVIEFVTMHKVACEGNKTKLMCNASNDDDAIHALQIKWYNSDGKQIRGDKTHVIHNMNDTATGQLQSVFHFDPVNRTDSQVYTCRAFNHPESYAQARSQLSVECKTCPVLCCITLYYTCRY